MGTSASKPNAVSNSVGPEGYEVSFKGNAIVIGAGVSGLLAGYLLKKQGIDVQIIEASSRWGGRIRDAQEGFADFKVALGAEWCHSKMQMVGGHDALCPIFQDITDGKSQAHEIFPDKVQDLNVYKKGKVKKYGRWSADKYFFNLDGDNKFCSSSWVSVFEERVLPAVKDSIVYNCPVTDINYENDKVVVKTQNDATYEAGKVVVCLPISILQKEMITFTPPQPAEQVADIKKVNMVPGCKVFMEFREKFYPHFLLMKDFTKKGYEHMYFDETVGKNSQKNILTAVYIGDETYKEVTSEGTNDEKIQEFMLKTLDGIFDGEASKQLLNCVVMDWTKEPFILGGVPDAEAKGYSKLKLSTPLANKVFFAGDAMNPDPHNCSFVQGACETSYIAVKKMLM
jgi:monoamine oxidase